MLVVEVLTECSWFRFEIVSRVLNDPKTKIFLSEETDER
jgi:hypothetical protein